MGAFLRKVRAHAGVRRPTFRQSHTQILPERHVPAILCCALAIGDPTITCRSGANVSPDFMPSILSQLDLALRRAIKDALNLDADPQLGPSQNANFGDYQSNAAMALAKSLGQKPWAVAEQIKSKVDLGDIASEISIAGPGFINIRLSPKWLAGTMDALRSDRAWGSNRHPPQDCRDRLFRPQHRQGNARGEPAQHDHRRCHQPGAAIPGTHDHPPEPHRRLGDAVRDVG